MGVPGERKQGGPREKVNREGALPLPGSTHSTPVGVPGLAAGHAAAPGGAGRRQGKVGAPPPQQITEEGALPPSSKKPGGCCPLQQRERGGLPPSLATHRGPGGPLAARGRRQGAGGAEPRGGSGHPESEGRGMSWFGVFMVVMGLVNLWLIGGVVEELGVMGGGEELGG